MLRVLRYAIGPNLNEQKAVTLRAHTLIVPRVEFDWTGDLGQKHHFVSKIKYPKVWAKRAKSELDFLSGALFEKSWGKIRLQGKVKISKLPITKIKSTGQGRYYIPRIQLTPLIKKYFPLEKRASFFIWVPSEGVGDPPPLLGSAYTQGSILSGANIVWTVIHSSEKRLSLEDAWAKRDGGGLVHEFYHHVERLVKFRSRFKGFIPSNHSSQQMELIRLEVLEQGLPEPWSQYEELFGMFPTWRMLRN